MRAYGVRQNRERQEELANHIDDLQRKAQELTE
jgi:hypothetical protein